MKKIDIVKKLYKVFTRKHWISPQWEPWEKCSQEEKVQFVHFCNLIALFAPKSLGAIAVSFEKCHPERQFIIYEKSLGHDYEFLSKRLKEEYREYE